jgi:hypothetical protein
MRRDLRSIAPILVCFALVPQILSIAAFLFLRVVGLGYWAYLAGCLAAGCAWSLAMIRSLVLDPREEPWRYWWLVLLVPLPFGVLPLFALLASLPTPLGRSSS